MKDNDPSNPDSRAENLGCGIALIVGGGIMIASQLGWIKRMDWILPAILLGWGASYLYKAFARK